MRKKKKATTLGYNSRSRYDMTYFVPAAALAEPLEYFFLHNPTLLADKNAMFVKLGDGAYKDRAGKDKVRPILSIILNDKLKQLIPDKTEVLADHTDKVKAEIVYSIKGCQ